MDNMTISRENLGQLKQVKISSIRSIGTRKIRNLTVDKNHTFITENGIPTHNCDGLGFAAQGILRATIEEFHKSTRFILTCNFKNKLIEPLHSRCQAFDFKIDSKDKPAVAATFFKRVCNILELENVTYDKKVVASLVQKYFPDFRKTLNELQRYSVSGTVDSGILLDQNTSFEELVTHMKAKKFGDIRKWVARNSDLEPAAIFRYFYDNLSNLVEGKNMPDIILLSAQYQDMSSRVVDQEINTMAYLVEILSAAQWKQ